MRSGLRDDQPPIIALSGTQLERESSDGIRLTSPSPTPRRIRPKLISEPDNNTSQSESFTLQNLSSSSDSRNATETVSDLSERRGNYSGTGVRKMLFEEDDNATTSDTDSVESPIDGSRAAAATNGRDSRTLTTFKFCHSAAASRWFAAWTLSLLSPVVLAMGHGCLKNLKRILTLDPVAHHAVKDIGFVAVSLPCCIVRGVQVNFMICLVLGCPSSSAAEQQ